MFWPFLAGILVFIFPQDPPAKPICEEMNHTYHEMLYWCHAEETPPRRRQYICAFVKEHEELCYDDQGSPR